MHGRRTLIVVSLVLIAVCVVARLAPHPPNFTPLAAAGLFCGFLFRGRLVGLLVPLTAMLVGDFLIGGYEPRIMAVVYAALLLPFFAHRFVRQPSLPRVAASAAACSVAFFLLTNGAVWAFGSMYTADAHGLARSLVAGLPFAKYTLAGDLVWAGVFFGSYALCTARFTRLAGLMDWKRAPSAS
jgi:hypothetical protein